MVEIGPASPSVYLGIPHSRRNGSQAVTADGIYHIVGDPAEKEKHDGSDIQSIEHIPPQYQETVDRSRHTPGEEVENEVLDDHYDIERIEHIARWQE
jgi:hypothetical protein